MDSQDRRFGVHSHPTSSTRNSLTTELYMYTRRLPTSNQNTKMCDQLRTIDLNNVATHITPDYRLLCRFLQAFMPGPRNIITCLLTPPKKLPILFNQQLA